MVYRRVWEDPKAVIIPVAIATIGWVATTENSLKAMELFAVGLASVSMIMLVRGISKRMHGKILMR